ncbi:Modular serine protease [Eumeta japonica]|uniref:Modular serine protease n=1 Tax=Eumeta variegata TaxID=151549 RepID=A0A4C1ZSY1_EUMVA|nr:Modular serine protease [Eumeta japonica]
MIERLLVCSSRLIFEVEQSVTLFGVDVNIIYRISKRKIETTSGGTSRWASKSVLKRRTKRDQGRKHCAFDSKPAVTLGFDSGLGCQYSFPSRFWFRCLYRFPNIFRSEREDWIKFVQIERHEPERLPSTTSTICSKPFQSENIQIGKTGRKSLKKNAVPFSPVDPTPQRPYSSCFVRDKRLSKLSGDSQSVLTFKLCEKLNCLGPVARRGKARKGRTDDGGAVTKLTVEGELCPLTGRRRARISAGKKRSRVLKASLHRSSSASGRKSPVGPCACISSVITLLASRPMASGRGRNTEDSSRLVCNQRCPLAVTAGDVPNGKGLRLWSEECSLPPHPEHGTYSVMNGSDSDPAKASDDFFLTYECDDGYEIVGEKNIHCCNGAWCHQPPKCSKMCLLDVHPSLAYTCGIQNDGSPVNLCGGNHRNGVAVLVKCRAPFFEAAQDLPPMICTNGIWNYIPKCTTVCGISKVVIDSHVIGGRNAKKGELPWHVGIYNKRYTPYRQDCSGTIIRSNLVVTAAHCFWRDLDGLQPASQFAVAAGKIYRPWNDPKDDKAQKSEITDIKVPPRFRGVQTNFQDDIALLLLATPFKYSPFVWPACINFQVEFDRKQLRDGNLGTVAGWGLTAVNGNESPILQVVELPYVDVGRCIDEVPRDFRRYITSDKICAGYANGTALCRGDSGGGLTFQEGLYLKRHYLRGLVSTAQQDANACNAFSLTTFTHVLAHEHFIRDHFDVNHL